LLRGIVTSVVVGLVLWLWYNLRTVGTLVGIHVTPGNFPPMQHWQSFYHSRLLAIQYNLVPIAAKKTLVLLAVALLCGIILRLQRRPLRPALALFWFGIAGLGLVQLANDASQLGRDSGNVLLLAGGSFTDVFFVSFTAFATVPCLLRRRQSVVFLWVLVTGYMLSVVALAPYTWGSGWGPRYLVGAYPFVAILVWLGFEAVQDRLSRVAVLTLLVCTVAIQALGVRYLGGVENKWAELNAELTTLQPDIVVTAIWWLPQVAAPTVGTMHWYGVTGNQDLETVASLSHQFWWVWTTESPTGFIDRQLQNTARLPAGHFSLIAKRQLATRGLEADLYQVVP